MPLATETVTQPRLYISADHYARLAMPPASPALERASKNVTKLARAFRRDPTIELDETGHNWHLIRARRMQTRIVTMLVEYRRSGNRRYRTGVLEDVQRLANWEYWSWITWRKQNADFDAIFDLSYGENSATLAIAFDGLRGELTDEEIALFVDTARRRSFGPFLHHVTKASPIWWFKAASSNWNTVCAGGAGMLALALGELCPESAQVVALANESVTPFFESLDVDGAWPEGIGYWNYGMRYGFMYLLSHERATGQPHPLMERPGTKATLRFPLLFSPRGVPCSFGDVNQFAPMPFHFAAAERLGDMGVVEELARRVDATQDAPSIRRLSWPDQAELLLLHPRQNPAEQPQAWPRASLQAGLHWGYAADQMPEPNLYIAVRGGTTDAPHVHNDLLSYHCLVGREKLIENIPVDDYLDTTFSTRRFDLYETSAISKNTLLIGGVGTVDKATAATSFIQIPGCDGFRMDATAAMGGMRDGPAADFCGRLILNVNGRAIVVVDRIETPHPALVEARLHTFYPVRFDGLRAQVRGKQNQLGIVFGASQPTLLKRGMGLPTSPARKPDTILRHVSSGKITAITLCHVLIPNGNGFMDVIEDTAEGLHINVSGHVAVDLTCSRRLDNLEVVTVETP